jgi:MFS family permease
MTHSPESLWTGRHIVAFALLAMALSGFGQTFFIAVLGADIRAAFDLSHSFYGGVYSAATLVSALLLLRVGHWVDHWSLARVTVTALGVLALGCALIGSAGHVVVLATGFLLVRFGGQGLIAHIGITTAGRHFHLHRGKAIACSAIGLPIAEAVLPLSALLLLGLGGWRMPWWVAAAFLVVVAAPVMTLLARRIRPIASATEGADARCNANESISFTRGEALHDPGFYVLLPAALTAPFIVTAVLFHQAALAAASGWSVELIASAFTGYALGHVVALLLAGPLVDRLGAHRVLPLAILPMALGLIALAIGGPAWVAFAYLGLTGVTTGLTGTAGGSLWAERYGVQHLGAIRSVAQAIMVISTAVAPITLGVLLDMGVSATAIGIMLAAATVGCAVLATFAPAPRRRASPRRSPA